MQLKSSLVALVYAATMLALPSAAIIPMTNSQISEWLKTVDLTNFTFIGKKLDALTPLDTTVVYCSTVAGSTCSGPCTVYTGNSICLHAPNTNCLTASTDVIFCANGACGGGCNSFSDCGTRLNDNYCYTPGTNSISVPHT